MAEADPKITKPAVAELQPAFAVRLDAFLRVKPFVSSEETRYYLNGIFVQAGKEGGAVCVASDGHRLGVRHDAAGVAPQSVIVRVPPELKLPKRGLFSNTPWLVCMTSGSRGHLSLVEPQPKHDDDTAEAAIENVDNCIMRFGRVLIDGTFPDWTRLIPAEKPKRVAGFNADYMKSFGKQIEIAGDDPSSPHVIQDDADRAFFGVLMPIRTSAGQIPGWISGIQYPA